VLLGNIVGIGVSYNMCPVLAHTLVFTHVGTVAVTRTILVCLVPLVVLVPLVCLCFNLMTFHSPLFIRGFHLGRKRFHIKCVPLTFYHFCMLQALRGAFCDEINQSEQIQRTEQNLTACY